MKKIISTLLAAAFVLEMGAAAFASPVKDTGEFVPKYTYSGENGMVFGKLSHPDTAPNSADMLFDDLKADGIVDYVGDGKVAAIDEGQGDRGESYPWACQTYGDYMYIGTTGAFACMLITQFVGLDNANGGTMTQENSFAMVDALLNGTLFTAENDGYIATMGSEHYTTQAVLLKINVNDPTDIKIIPTETDELPSSTGVVFRGATTSGGNLYFTGSSWGIPQIWKVDPRTDTATLIFKAEQVFVKGVLANIRGICDYKGHLVFSSVYFNSQQDFGNEIYISKTTNPTCADDFVKIADQKALFGYPAVTIQDSNLGGGVHEIIEYNDKLYVSIVSGKRSEGVLGRPFALVSGELVGDPNAKDWSGVSFNWEAVCGKEEDGAKYPFGIDPERTQSIANNMFVYNGYLYIGEYNDESNALKDITTNYALNFERMAKNIMQSVGVYRMDENENFELIVGDATTMFPDGGQSGYGSGFNAPTNIYIWQMTEYNGKLFIGTFDTSSVLEPLGQFTNGDILNWQKEDWIRELKYILTMIEVLSKDTEQPQPKPMLKAAAPKSAEQIVAESLSKVNEELSDVYAPKKRLMAAAPKAGAPKNNALNPAALDLTEEQIDKLAGLLRSGTVIAGSLLPEALKEIKSLVMEMLKGYEELGAELTDEFVERFEKWADALDDLADDTFDKVVDELREIVNDENLKKLNYALYCAVVLKDAERGFDLYVSEDGVNFECITTNGFGDPYNYGARIYGVQDVPGNHWFVLGTANPFYGAQLWKLMDNVTDPKEADKPWQGLQNLKLYHINKTESVFGTTKLSTVVSVQAKEVTFTAKPAEGCLLESLTVTDARGQVLKVKDCGSGKYSFNMASSDVTVDAVYAPIPIGEEAEEADE